MGIKKSRINPPDGDYFGTARLISQTDNEGKVLEVESKVIDLKLTILPREEGFTDGVGVLIINDRADKFFWRDVGNHENTWNLLFFKDNNLYSDIKDSFRFQGLVAKKSVENTLEGTLYRNTNSRITEYFLEATQSFKPKILPPQTGIAVKAGENFVITGERIGEDTDNLKVLLMAKSDEEPIELEIMSMSPNPKKDEESILEIKSSEKLEKGDYKFFLKRGTKFKSNSLKLTII